MNKQKEMTAWNTSVGADDRQSLHGLDITIYQWTIYSAGLREKRNLNRRKI